SRVALYSKPGSRNRADRSMKPGATMHPFASIVRLALQPAGACPIAATFPATTNSDVARSTPCFGSIRRPFLISIFKLGSSARPAARRPLCAPSGGSERSERGGPLVPCQHAHYRHPHSDAERDLRQNHRPVAVSYRRIDLDAAIHRSRMHDDGAGLREGSLVLR